MENPFPEPLSPAAVSAVWISAWKGVGRPAPPGLRQDLERAWSEPHRHYHDLRHLRECLALLTRWRYACDRPSEVAIALWFHDAIYDPRSSDNELQSAAWAARSLAMAGAGSETVQRVYDLVMATQHGVAAKGGEGADARALVDIDLAILGSPPKRFQQFDEDVRKEYAWAPWTQYRERRTEVLQAFLDRPSIYESEIARDLLAAQARTNLAAALRRLAQ